MKATRTNRIRTLVSVALITLTLGTGIALSAVESASARTHAFVMERGGLGHTPPRSFMDPPAAPLHRRGIGFLEE
jgi:hypothetical protein